MCQQKGNKREEARSRYEGSNQKEEAIALLVGIPFHGEVWSELWREGRRGGVSTVGFVQVDFQKSAAGSRSRSVFVGTTNGKAKPISRGKSSGGPTRPTRPTSLLCRFHLHYSTAATSNVNTGRKLDFVVCDGSPLASDFTRDLSPQPHRNRSIKVAGSRLQNITE